MSDALAERAQFVTLCDGWKNARSPITTGIVTVGGRFRGEARERATLTRRRRRPRPEDAIQRAVVQHYKVRRAPGVFMFAVPHGGFRRPIGLWRRWRAPAPRWSSPRASTTRSRCWRAGACCWGRAASRRPEEGASAGGRALCLDVAGFPGRLGGCRPACLRRRPRPSLLREVTGPCRRRIIQLSPAQVPGGRETGSAPACSPSHLTCGTGTWSSPGSSLGME